MKILFIHNKYQFKGGEDQVVEDEKKLLEKNGHIIHAYFRNNREINNYNIKERLLFLINSLFSFKTLKELNKILKKNNPDVAQVYNIFPLISPSVYWVLKKNRIPIVQMINNFRLLCINGLFLDRKGICEKCKNGNFVHGILKKCNRESIIISLLYALITTLIRKYFINKINIFVVSNEFVKQKYVEGGFNPETIKIKPNFINNNYYANQIDKSPEKYIAYVGRISKEKGIHTLINAMKYCSDIKLKIIGTGPELNNIRRFIKDRKLSNIDILGYLSQEEKELILKNTFFLIFPSECYENFPVTILEAYKFGIPIIGSNHGAMISLIEDNVTGFHFKVGDVKDLAQKIKKLWSSPELRDKLSINAKRKIENDFSPEYSYRILRSIYAQIR